MIKTLLELSGLEVTALHRAVLLEAVVWLSMLAAVVIDFMTGIRKARREGGKMVERNRKGRP